MSRGFDGFGSYITGSKDEELKGEALIKLHSYAATVHFRESVQNAVCQIASTSHDLLEIPVQYTIHIGSDHVSNHFLNQLEGEGSGFRQE